MQKKAFDCVILILLALAGSAIADTPLRKPYDHIICSNLAHHCAFISPDAAKIFSIWGGNKHIQVEYLIPGWYPYAFISDDGGKFISIASIISSDHIEDQPVLTLWIVGVLKKVYIFMQNDFDIHGNNGSTELIQP